MCVMYIQPAFSQDIREVESPGVVAGRSPADSFVDPDDSINFTDWPFDFIRPLDIAFRDI